MGDNINTVDTMPTLTLEPFDPAQQPAALGQPQQPVAQEMAEYKLSPEEKKVVDNFARQIDLRNSAMVMNYGAAAQKKMSDFSGAALDNVRTKDTGEIGELLTGLVKELKGLDKEEKPKGFRGFFRKQTDKLELMKVNYDSVATNVDGVVKTLNTYQVQLLKDVAVLDKMYDKNLAYFKELSMYIIAGEQKVKEVRETELKEATEKAQRSNLPEDAQAAKDLEDICARFERKLYDLKLTRTIAMQMGPQIRLIQGNDEQMAEKIQSTIVNTIPLWKNQMMIALGLEHSMQAAVAQREVTDMTNELLKKNAENLKLATVETAKEAERGIVDIETLKQTNETLISTFDEVLTIQKEGREKRAEAEKELRSMEDELKQKLLAMAG